MEAHTEAPSQQVLRRAPRYIDTVCRSQHTSPVPRRPLTLLFIRQLGVVCAAGACSTPAAPSGLNDAPVHSAPSSGTAAPDAGTSPTTGVDSEPEPAPFIRFEIAIWNDGPSSMALLTDGTYCDPFELVVADFGNIAPSNAEPTPVSEVCCTDYFPGLGFTEVAPGSAHIFVVDVGADVWLHLVTWTQEPIEFRFGVERAECLSGSCDGEFYSSDSPELCPLALHASRFQPLTLSDEAWNDLLALDALPVVLSFDVHTSSDN